MLTVATHLLADGVDVGAGDLVRTCHVIFQVYFFAQVHIPGDCGENKSLLSSIGQRELYLPVQTAGTEQSGVECVVSIGCHYHL